MLPSIMNPFLKIGLEFGPLISFFVTYNRADIYWATGVFMVATVVAAAISYALVRKVSRLMMFSAVVVMVFGGLTLWLQDSTFIKMKPTIYYVSVAGILLGGLVFGRLVVKDVMDVAMHLSDEGWRKFTIRIAVFFLCMAVLNEAAWRNLTEQQWVWLKVWGFLPLSFVFFAAQMPLLMRYEVKPPDETSRPT